MTARAAIFTVGRRVSTEIGYQCTARFDCETSQPLASDVKPKFVSRSDPAAQCTGAMKGHAFVAYRDRFNGGKDGTRWNYTALADVFSRAMPGPLSDRLSRAVALFG